MVLDALNFCFWPSSTRLEYDTLAIGLRKALEDDPDVFSPVRLQHVTEDDIRGWISKAGPLSDSTNVGTTTTRSSNDSEDNGTVLYHDLPNVRIHIEMKGVTTVDVYCSTEYLYLPNPLPYS